MDFADRVGNGRAETVMRRGRGIILRNGNLVCQRSSD